MYQEQLEQILAFTKLLNENGDKLPLSEDFHLRVQLVENYGENRVVGEWSDEIGPDCWEFAVVTPDPPKINMHNGVPGARGI